MSSICDALHDEIRVNPCSIGPCVLETIARRTVEELSRK